MDKEKQHKVSINEVIERALETLELGLESFKEIAREYLKGHLTPERQLDLNHAPGIKVICIIKLLHLSSSHLHGGYNQKRHLTNICHDIEKNQFHYKKSKLVKAAWKEFKRSDGSMKQNFLALDCDGELDLNAGFHRCSSFLSNALNLSFMVFGNLEKNQDLKKLRPWPICQYFSKSEITASGPLIENLCLCYFNHVP